MTGPGSDASALRVAIVGSGPAGFYLAERLLKEELAVQVDMYERLPAPFGLVRFGVAPDHEKIKNVTRVFDRVAAHEGFRFFGNVSVGSDVELADLEAHYHAICYATGAQTDRSLGIPGEGLERSRAATEFVAWYNGHPDYRDQEFDLSVERVAVVGVGNVAVDVSRMLCRTPEELETTDIADHALAALRRSQVREVWMLGRRGPAQAAFTNPEVKELGELPGADICVLREEIELDPLSKADVEARQDREILRKLQILDDFANREPEGKPRRLAIRFLVSPVELVGDDAGRVVGMKLVRNELYRREDGVLRPRPTDEIMEVPVGLVFRSVGYRAVPLPGLPFDDRRGVVPNEAGRVIDPGTGRRLIGIYVSGWIKRGATGVIGTNKPDAAETVDCLLQDLASGRILEPARADPAAVEALVRERVPDYVSYEDWLRIKELEEAAGESEGRPRVKFTSVQEMLEAAERE